jgi:hypothetical protein
MVNYPKLVVSYPNLENLLEPFFMSYDLGTLHFCPCYVEPYTIKVSL